MPCPSTGPKMFWARPKNELDLVLLQNILWQHRTEFTVWNISFGLAQKVWDLHNTYVNQF